LQSVARLYVAFQNAARKLVADENPESHRGHPAESGLSFEGDTKTESHLQGNEDVVYK
jgi:hypothetical protein